MTDQMQLAVNHAVNDLRMARARESLIRPGMGMDAKRNSAWCEYGFKENLEYRDFYNLYRRGGVAHGAVEKIVTTCWKTAPWVIEGDEQDGAKNETAWERQLKAISMGGRLWRWLAEADRRRLVGRYSAVLIHVRDSQPWDKPVTGKGRGIEKLTPVWAGSIKPVSFDDNPKSATYGEPALWQYNERGVGGGGGRQLDVHPDRVFILGDWSTDAIGFLEPAYNAFVSLEKVEGGSGESFLKNASRQLSISFDKEVDLANIASMYGVSMEDLHKKFNDAARDINQGNDTLLINQGATVNPLVSTIPDPSPTYNVNLQTASAALDIPSKILVGMQTGERASSEDQKYFNGRCQSRRGELGFELHSFVEHLIRIGCVKPVSEFAVMWDDLTEASPTDKLTNAKTLGEINEIMLASGEVTFTAEEIREAAGYDPLDDPEPLPDDEEEDADPESTDPAGE